MSPIFENSLPVRTRLLKAGELFFVLAAVALPYKLYEGENLTPVTAFGTSVGLVAIIILLFLYVFGFYNPSITIRRIQSALRIMQATGLTMLVIGLLLEAEVARFNNAGPALIGILLVAIGLTISRYLFGWLAQNPALAQSAIVWGSGPLAASIIR